MENNKKDDKLYLQKMLDIINYIEKYLNNMENNNLKMEPNSQYADGVIYKFIQLREEAKNLSEDLLLNNPVLSNNIKPLIGFRNRLTHDYENVSYSFFDEIIENDLPILKNEIIKCLNSSK